MGVSEGGEIVVPWRLVTVCWRLVTVCWYRRNKVVAMFFIRECMHIVCLSAKVEEALSAVFIPVCISLPSQVSSTSSMKDGLTS